MKVKRHGKGGGSGKRVEWGLGNDEYSGIQRKLIAKRTSEAAIKSYR